MSGLEARSGSGGIASIPLLRTFESRRFRLIVATFLALLGVAMNLIGWPCSTRTRAVAFDFAAYYHAAERMLAGASPYTAAQLEVTVVAYCFDCYLYPPFFAQILSPITLVPLEAAKVIWLAIAYVAAFASTWLATGIGGAARSLERAVWCLAAVTLFEAVSLSGLERERRDDRRAGSHDGGDGRDRCRRRCRGRGAPQGGTGNAAPCRVRGRVERHGRRWWSRSPSSRGPCSSLRHRRGSSTRRSSRMWSAVRRMSDGDLALGHVASEVGLGTRCRVRRAHCDGVRGGRLRPGQHLARAAARWHACGGAARHRGDADHPWNAVAPLPGRALAIRRHGLASSPRRHPGRPAGLVGPGEPRALPGRTLPCGSISARRCR